MRIVIGLGGNALLRSGEEGSFKEQEENFTKVLRDIERLQRNHELVITHGNGPQVGNLLIQQESTDEVPGMPLDVCVSMTQGQIGYLIQKNLSDSVSLVTQVEIDSDDLEVEPTKPIGPYYSDKIDEYMVKEPEGWRKVVVSPKPVEIIELDSIETLLEKRKTVICSGGGGIPVTSNGRFVGREAVIDKDRTTSLLARKIDADLILFYTDIDYLYKNFGEEDQKPIREINVDEAQRLLSNLPEGSMKPKLESAINFVSSCSEGSKKAVIGNKIDVSGEEGTVLKKN